MHVTAYLNCISGVATNA